jgi:hypothetical protein
MKLGDHLRVNRNGVLDHAIDCGDGTVIRFVPASGGGWAEVRRARLLDFAAGAERVEVVKYPSLVYPADMVVARAFSRLGESAAGTMFGGPEHFATWCMNGQAPVRPLPGPSPASPPPPPAEPPAAAPPRPAAPKAAARPAAKAGKPARAAPPKRAAKAKARPAPARKRKAASGKPAAKAGRAKAPARKAPARRPAKGRAAKRRR